MAELARPETSKPLYGRSLCARPGSVVHGNLFVTSLSWRNPYRPKQRNPCTGGSPCPPPARWFAAILAENKQTSPSLPRFAVHTSCLPGFWRSSTLSSPSTASTSCRVVSPSRQKRTSTAALPTLSLRRVISGSQRGSAGLMYSFLF
jgi:hypothetical protein